MAIFGLQIKVSYQNFYVLNSIEALQKNDTVPKNYQYVYMKVFLSV